MFFISGMINAIVDSAIAISSYTVIGCVQLYSYTHLPYFDIEKVYFPNSILIRQPSHQTEPSKNHPRRPQPELWQSSNHPGQYRQNQ